MRAIRAVRRPSRESGQIDRSGGPSVGSERYASGGPGPLGGSSSAVEGSGPEKRGNGRLRRGGHGVLRPTLGTSRRKVTEARTAHARLNLLRRPLPPSMARRGDALARFARPHGAADRAYRRHPSVNSSAPRNIACLRSIVPEVSGVRPRICDRPDLLCVFCFGPLEVAYDYDAIGRLPPATPSWGDRTPSGATRRSALRPGVQVDRAPASRVAPR